MTEIWFYHLERRPLERVLPSLLERTLARNWRAVVQATNGERVASLDSLLWTYDNASFLPHGTARSGRVNQQPVFLTDDESNPNAAQLRFLVDGAWLDEKSDYERVVILFDGGDKLQLDAARSRWMEVKSGGYALNYFQETEDGRWEKKA